jgi:multiple sugar transport system substrate-binding protein
MLVMAMLIATIVLSACAPAATTAPTTAPTSAPALTKPAATTAPVTKTKVRIFSWWDITTSVPLQELKKGFESKNPDLELDFVNVPSAEYYDKMLTMIAGGADLPDVMMLAMDKVPVFADRGAIQKLDTLVTDDFKKDLYPVALSAASYKGGLYAMPRDITPKVVFLNKTVFKAAGVDLPKADWTVEQFRDIAKKLTKVENNNPVQWGFYFPKYADGWYHWVRLFDGSFFDETGTKTTLGSDNSLAAVKFLTDMALVDKSVPSESQAKQFGTNDQAVFIANKVGMVAGGLSYTVAFDKEKIDYVVMPLPVGKKTLTTAFVNAWTLPKGAKNSKNSMRVMQYLSGKEGQQIVLNTGMGLPTSKSVDTAAFLSKRADYKVFTDTLTTSEPFPAPLYGANFYTEMTKQLDLMWLGQAKAEDVIPALVKSGNKILAGEQ